MLSTGRPQLPSDIAASRVSGPKQTRAARNTYPEDSESPTSDATSKSVERTTSTGRSQPLLAGAGKRVMSKGSSNTSRTTATAVPSTDLNKAAEAARNDVNEESAIAWAQGYLFPSEYLASDLGCLCAAQLDFVAMVRRRLKTLSSNHLNHQRVAGLRKDNPEILLLTELVACTFPYRLASPPTGKMPLPP